MAQTDTRPGFRLPWSSDRADDSDSTGAAPDATADLGDAPATEQTEDAAMTDVSSVSEESTASEAIADPNADAEPEVVDDAPTAEAPIIELPVAAEEAAPAARTIKSTKFLADLTKAMQATAEAARDETLERFTADAKAATERVQAEAAEEITELRRSADEDVAAIREWSKGEIARIREETETRINARKSYLEGELEEHASVIEHRVELISGSVATFETEMAAFCERLFAEGDPATFAAMAEQLPEPPSLNGPFIEPQALIGVPVVPAWSTPEIEAVSTPADVADQDASPEAPEVPDAPADVAEAEPEAAEALPETTDEGDSPESAGATADAPETTPETTSEAPAESDMPVESESDDPRIAMLGLGPDFAAAEAEAANENDSGEDADDASHEIPAIAEEVVAARLAGLVPPSDAGDPAERLTTRVVVSGLVSVASIAAFKRGVARTQGVASVGVTSGPDGEFVFMVSHSPTVDLKDVIPGLPGFGARVTGDSEDGFVVTARDPEAHV